MSAGHLDRQMNPTARQGAMDANAKFDFAALAAIRRDQQKGPATPYPQVERDTIFNINGRELVFFPHCKHRGDNGGALTVLSALNGLGADAARMYRGDIEMQKEAIKNGITYVGVSTNSVGASPLERENGVAVSVAGLTTIQLGETSTTSGKAYAKPGDIIKAALPIPGQPARTRTDGGVMEPGLDPAKYRLQAVPSDPEDSAHALLTNIRAIVNDPATWRQAMGASALPTNGVMSAAKNVVDSYAAAALFGLREFIAAGLVEPTAALRAMMPDDAAIAGRQVEDPLAAGTDAERQGRIYANGEIGDIVATYLAEYMQLVPSQPHRAALTAAQSDAMKLLRVNLAQRTFFSSYNSFYEMGHRPGVLGALPVRRGRNDANHVKHGTPEGELVELQLNHVVRAVGGFHAFIQRELQFVIGKTTTGASVEGSGKMHIAQGVCRP